MRVTESSISERAYSIWEREGRPAGKELDHWLQAEAELNTTRVDAPKSTASRRDLAETARIAKPAATKIPRKRSARKS